MARPGRRSRHNLRLPPGLRRKVTYDSVTQKVVLFGGFNGTYLDDTMALGWIHVTVDAGDTPASPPAVTSPNASFPIQMARADLFGGFDGHFYHLPCGNGTVPIGCSYFRDGSVCSCISGRWHEISSTGQVVCSADSLM